MKTKPSESASNYIAEREKAIAKEWEEKYNKLKELINEVIRDESTLEYREYLQSKLKDIEA